MVHYNFMLHIIYHICKTTKTVFLTSGKSHALERIFGDFHVAALMLPAPFLASAGPCLFRISESAFFADEDSLAVP